jgi:hypothetical protein
MDAHHSTARLARTAAVVAVAVLAIAAPTAGAGPSRTTKVTYAGSEFGSDLGNQRATPVGTVAPIGQVHVLTSRSSVTLTIDDSTALPGTTLYAFVSVGRKTSRLCVPAGTPTTIPVPPAENVVEIWLPGPSYRVDGGSGGCDSTVTAGVLTLVH